MELRAASIDELEHLATLWHEGWHQAHAAILPAELSRLRTPERFRERLPARLDDLRVVGPAGAAVGLCIVKVDELYQLYVAAPARGSGVAAVLLADGERRLARSGVTMAWLSCAIGNERAARFYEKHGWQRTGTMIYESETEVGTYPVKVWRYEKRLTPI